MEVLNLDHIDSEREEIEDKIISGQVFIYPTDTIYGLGCDATNSEAVNFIRKLKNRDSKPFSIIAPSIKWIKENCVIGEKEEVWLGRLPGPITLILNLKKDSCVAKEVNNGMKTIGVRIPDHGISGFISNLNIPVVTTSVNVSGGQNMVSLECLDEDFKKNISFCIYEGKKEGTPSTIIDLTGDEEKIIDRK